MRHWQRCIPINFAKFLKTPFFQNTSGRLLLIFGSLRHFITKCDKEGRTRNQTLVTERLIFRLNRVEAKTNSFSKSFSKVRNLRAGPLCISSILPGSSPHVLEKSQTFQISWTQKWSYSFSCFSLVGRVLSKIMIYQVTLMHGTIVWQSYSFYPQLFQLFQREKFSFFLQHTQSTNRTKSAKSLFNRKRKLATAGMDFRRNLLSQLPENKAQTPDFSLSKEILLQLK